MEQDPVNNELQNVHIPNRIIELAKLGELDSIGLRSALYRSSHEGVESILTSLINEVTGKCRAVVKYDDGTSYDITWDEGDVWSLSHNDIAYNQNHERVLPHTGGLLRSSYVYKRVISPVNEAKGFLNTHNVLTETFDDMHGSHETDELIIPSNSEISDTLNKLFERKRDNDNKYDSLFKAIGKAFLDIDPSDVDLQSLSLPILEINPSNDRIAMQ